MSLNSLSLPIVAGSDLLLSAPGVMKCPFMKRDPVVSFSWLSSTFLQPACVPRSFSLSLERVPKISYFRLNVFLVSYTNLSSWKFVKFACFSGCFLNPSSFPSVSCCCLCSRSFLNSSLLLKVSLFRLNLFQEVS